MQKSRLVPFLKDLFTDVRESEETPNEYFENSTENKNEFKKKEIFHKHLGTVENSDKLIDTLFEKMAEDASNGSAHLYMPSQNGAFTNEQTSIFYRLSEIIEGKSGVELPPLPSVKTTIKETSKRLTEAGNLTIVEPLRLNKMTGLIEGEVINPNDPDKQVLTVKIDSSRPEEIEFENKESAKAFKVENSDSGLGIFIGTKTGEIAVLVEYSETRATENKPEQPKPEQPKPEQQPDISPIALIPSLKKEEDKGQDQVEMPDSYAKNKSTQIQKSFLIPTETEEISETQDETRTIRKTRKPRKIYKEPVGQTENIRPPSYTENIKPTQTGAQTETKDESQKRQLGRHTNDQLKQREEQDQREKAGIKGDENKESGGQKKGTSPQKKKGSYVSTVAKYAIFGGGLGGGSILGAIFTGII